MTNATNPHFECSRKANSNSEYHSDKDILSSTMLKDALVSPLAFIHTLTSHTSPTQDMCFGSLMHALIMEPHTVNDLVAVSPSPLSNNSESRSFRAANRDRFCLWIGDLAKAQLLADKTLNEKFKGRPFFKYVEESLCEQSIYYTDPTTGLKCRVRPDMEHPDFTFDLKTTRFCGPREFQLDAIRKHYDLSAYMYSYARVLAETQACGEVVQPKPFVIVPIFKTEPYGVFFRTCSDEFIINGGKKYQSALQTIAACRSADFWPSTSGEIELGIDHWQQFDSKNAPWLTALQ